MLFAYKDLIILRFFFSFPYPIIPIENMEFKNIIICVFFTIMHYFIKQAYENMNKMTIQIMKNQINKYTKKSFKKLNKCRKKNIEYFTLKSS